MASAREYCKMLSTEQLQALLREEYNGRGSLPVLLILDICDILAERDPEKPSAEQLIRQLCRQYFPEE